jgi:hypothetical protein
VNSANQSSFRSILLGHHDLGESGLGRRGHGGKHAAYWTETAVEAELAEEHHPSGCRPRHLARRGQHRDCDGQGEYQPMTLLNGLGATVPAQARRREYHPVHEAAYGSYLRSREHGMVIVPCPHVQVVIVPLVPCSQAVSIRSATGSQ